jgi:ABC-type bacteriocin/lantibiotic exporter with double-glycine peptidase domain
MNRRSLSQFLLAILVSSPVSCLCAAALAGEIAVPWIKQKTPTECGRAALASVAARHGGDAEKIYQQLPAPPDRKRGYSIVEMQKFAVEIGVNLLLIQPEGVVIAGECSERPAVSAYFATLARTVAEGHPVVVPIGDASSRGHYLVLVSANGGDFTALDPSAPGRKKVSARELRTMMCGFGYVALVDID